MDSDFFDRPAHGEPSEKLMKSVSLIIPFYNEESVIERFYAELTAVIDPLKYMFDVICVNDGSKDSTQTILESLAASDVRLNVIELSRNFGHQAALCAGLESAAGDFVITMDGDGQHPPSLIPEMLELAEAGYDIVMTQRTDNGQGSWFKRSTSGIFYRLLNKISDTNTLPGGADFRLITHQVLENLLAMPEYHRFLRGMISWLGFKSVIIPFTPPPRLAGQSKYSLKKMFKLASDAVFSFSLTPLYIGLTAGVIFLLAALAEVIYVMSFWVSGRSHQLEPGWSSLMFMLLIVAGVLMILLGFIGIYVGYIFQEVKHRPVFVVKKEKSGGLDETIEQEEDGE